MELKFYLVLATGLIPLLVGMIWYSKALFANAWMQASGMTEEKGKSIYWNLTVLFGKKHLKTSLEFADEAIKILEELL